MIVVLNNRPETKNGRFITQIASSTQDIQKKYPNAQIDRTFDSVGDALAAYESGYRPRGLRHMLVANGVDDAAIRDLPNNIYVGRFQRPVYWVNSSKFFRHGGYAVLLRINNLEIKRIFVESTDPLPADSPAIQDAIRQLQATLENPVAVAYNSAMTR